MKLCIDCKWVESTGPQYICGKVSAATHDLVTGKKHSHFVLCAAQRWADYSDVRSGFACGVAGVWWEDKTAPEF